MKKLIRCAAVTVAIAIAGCGDDSSSGEADAGSRPEEDAGNNPPVDAMQADTCTLNDLHQQIFLRTCGGPLCHGAGSQEVLLINPMTEYESLVGKEASGDECGDSGLTLVVPGDPEASLLYQKVGESPPCGDRMPGGGVLDESQIELIRCWIADGAPGP